MTARNDNDPPIASEPVSPMNARAGYLLYKYRPSKQPTMTSENVRTSVLSEIRKKNR
ncbi:hypothetical protein D3C84_990980 [compost metagenome]